MALETRTARTARHLMQQLERPLCSPRIAVGKAKIGVDNADQRHQREIMPLCHQLRADDDIRLALGNCLQLEPQPLHAARHVGG